MAIEPNSELKFQDRYNSNSEFGIITSYRHNKHSKRIYLRTNAKTNYHL